MAIVRKYFHTFDKQTTKIEFPCCVNSHQRKVDCNLPQPLHAFAEKFHYPRTVYFPTSCVLFNLATFNSACLYSAILVCSVTTCEGGILVSHWGMSTESSVKFIHFPVTSNQKGLFIITKLLYEKL